MAHRTARYQGAIVHDGCLLLIRVQAKRSAEYLARDGQHADDARSAGCGKGTAERGRDARYRISPKGDLSCRRLPRRCRNARSQAHCK